MSPDEAQLLRCLGATEGGHGATAAVGGSHAVQRAAAAEREPNGGVGDPGVMTGALKP